MTGDAALGPRYLPNMRAEVRRCGERIAEFEARALTARDDASAGRARERAMNERRSRVRWFAAAHLPPSAEGIGLVHRLDRFLRDRGDDLGPELIDALATFLDPDRRSE